MRVLITDGDSRSALAAVRSLGRRGLEIIVTSDRSPCLASASRFAAVFEQAPSPADCPLEFVAAIADIARRRSVHVVLPMTEVTTLLLSESRSRLPAGCQLPLPEFATIVEASNKANMVRLAEELGVPTPHTLVVGSADEGSDAGQVLSYPVVVKPSRSRVRAGQTWFSNSVSYASDANALRSALESLPPHAYPVLVQERIEGPGRGVFGCFDYGKPVALFAHRRLREKPPSGGVSVLCESVALDPVAAEYAVRLLGRLSWHGVAMVEFKQDRRDDELRLMEINARFWGSLQLAIDAGVDFPSIAVDLACRNPLPSNPVYRSGVRLRWLAGDLDAMIAMLIRSRRRLNLPDSHPGRLRTLREFLDFRTTNTHFEIERSDDPGPARLEWRRRILGR